MSCPNTHRGQAEGCTAEGRGAVAGLRESREMVARMRGEGCSKRRAEVPVIWRRTKRAGEFRARGINTDLDS